MRNKITKIKAAIFSGVMVLGIAGVNVTASITADHEYNINWNQGYRWVTASTQGYQVNDRYGTAAEIASYTRAYFEHEWWQGGGIYGDSGRKWSKQGTTEKSHATSGTELKKFNSGVAKSNWGT